LKGVLTIGIIRQRIGLCPGGSTSAAMNLRFTAKNMLRIFQILKRVSLYSGRLTPIFGMPKLGKTAYFALKCHFAAGSVD